MKRFIALTAVCVAAVCVAGAGARSSALTLRGAGSSFVSPLVLTWVQPYEAATGVHIDYNPIGSGGGIQAIQNRQVDFGASDAPMTPDQFNGCNGCVQIPWEASGTSIAYNLQGAPPHLKITGPVLANIYLGKIKKWNDAALKKLNPGVNLPDTEITPIWRSDGSGTTYNVTDYLAKVSGEFKSKIGVGTQVNFPVGTGGRGSSGVSAVLSRTNGGIIYVDVAFATKNHFSFFSVKNKAGKYTASGHEADQGGDADGEAHHARQQDLDRRPAEVGAGGLSDLHLHVHHPPAEERERSGAAPVRPLGDDERREEVRAGTPVRSDPAERAQRGEQDAQESSALARLQGSVPPGAGPGHCP